MSITPHFTQTILASILVLSVPLRAADNVNAVLTVTTVVPQTETWPVSIAASGNVSPWQEAVVAAEIGGLRITHLAVDVGSRVQRGQEVAQLSSDTVQADLATQQARLAQAAAALSEAQANGARARELAGRAALSEQQIKQYLVAEQTARANLAAAEAQLKSQQIRLEQTHIHAPDDGIITGRTATLGSVVQAGTELFRLLRQNRIEWRAEIMAEQLAQIRPGQTARIRPPGGNTIAGVVRLAAPTFDPATRLALVYVDIAEPGLARVGMFAEGEIQVNKTLALSVPETAVVLRDGNSYVFEVDAEARIIQHKVLTGRRLHERVEIISGLPAQARVAISGGGFLNDGDRVRLTTTDSGKTAP